VSTLQRGTAFTIQTVCYDMVTPTDPINVATQISKDGGPFVATTNAPSVTSPGLVTVALTAAEMTCDRFAIKVTSSNLEPHIVPYYTEDSYTGDRAARLDATVSSRAPSGEYDTPMARLDATVSSRSSHSATDVRDTILSDATKFKGADIATIASDVAGLDGAAMRGTNGAALAADWTATRAGHIDKLNVSGTLAHSDDANRYKADVSGLSPAGEYNGPMANLDAKVSSRSTLTATDVWSNPGRTLTSFGTLVSDIATAVWSSVVRTITGGKVDTVDGKDLTNLDVPVSTRAVPGDQMDLVTAINSAALNTLNNAITVTLTQQDIEDLVHGIAENLESIDISADSIAQLVASVLNGLAGVGGLAVTIPVVFAEGAVPIPGLYYRVERADGTIVSWWKTDENGHINLLLDGGTYYIWLENNINYNILNPYEYVVEESGTYDPIEVSPVLGIAPPHEPNICTCYMDIRYAAGEQAGELVGEKEAWIDILDVSGRGKKGPLDLSGELPLAALSGQRVYSDSRGRVAFPAIRGVDLRISLTRPWSVNEKQLTNSIQFTVPDETTYAIEFEG
jgi:hypothetical protein